MDPILGQIALLAFGWTPQGWASCEGQILQIGDYQALFSLIGTTYGGDGKSTFALPNLKAQAEAFGGAQFVIAVEGIYPSRP
ncbi:tail fiber protein [Nocardia sp. NPDC046473]|uniref:phage tail protein n=1 Tax=Nocardia sp. NPDC046473 TaxID=3155733 RepID=UPI003402B202